VYVYIYIYIYYTYYIQAGEAPSESELQDSEECNMCDADIATMGGRDPRGGSQFDDEDDDEGGQGGPGVQCAQQ
jgi:hypothetical protein